MYQPERFLIACMVGGLFFASGGRPALAQTPDGGTVTFTRTENWKQISRDWINLDKKTGD